MTCRDKSDLNVAKSSVNEDESIRPIQNTRGGRLKQHILCNAKNNFVCERSSTDAAMLGCDGLCENVSIPECTESSVSSENTRPRRAIPDNATVRPSRVDDLKKRDVPICSEFDNASDAPRYE